MLQVIVLYRQRSDHHVDVSSVYSSCHSIILKWYSSHTQESHVLSMLQLICATVMVTRSLFGLLGGATSSLWHHGFAVRFHDPCTYFTAGKVKASTLSLTVLAPRLWQTPTVKAKAMNISSSSAVANSASCWWVLGNGESVVLSLNLKALYIFISSKWTLLGNE